MQVSGSTGEEGHRLSPGAITLFTNGQVCFVGGQGDSLPKAQRGSGAQS